MSQKSFTKQINTKTKKNSWFNHYLFNLKKLNIIQRSTKPVRLENLHSRKKRVSTENPILKS